MARGSEHVTVQAIDATTRMRARARRGSNASFQPSETMCDAGAPAEEMNPSEFAPAIATAYSNKIERLPLDETPGVQMSFVARYARDNALPLDVAEQHVGEYVRFLALKSVCGRAVPPPIIDTVYHQHLAYTRSYARFCEALLGKGGFIHHEPSIGGDSEELAATYGRTLACYEAAYGVEPPSDIWIPSGSKIVRKTSIPVKELLLLRRDAFTYRADQRQMNEVALMEEADETPYPGALSALFESQLGSPDESLTEKTFFLCASEIFGAPVLDPLDLARCACVCKAWYIALTHADLLPSSPFDEEEEEGGFSDEEGEEAEEAEEGDDDGRG